MKIITEIILPKTIDLIKLLNIHLSHFPKHEKYGLTQQIRNSAYSVFTLLIECKKRYHKKTTLTELDIKHEQLRMLINLAFELGYYHYKDSSRGRSDLDALHRYTAISCLVNELGRLIGTWIKIEKEKSDK